MTDVFKLVLIVLVAASGWFGRGMYEETKETAVKAAIEKVNISVAKQISEIQLTNKIVYNKTIEHINTELKYTDCIADDYVMNLTNKVIVGETWK